jgi:trimeric autotransporter adhesin
MQRLLTLVFLLCLAIPAGISFSGCTRNPQANYCNGEGFGPKLTAVASITLQPQTTGISLAYGQTQQLAAPTAKTCKGTAASVGSYSYGTTNNQIVDISPTGNLCAGTWNRNSGGGIPNFTVCNIPSPLPTTSGLPYVTAGVTATGEGVTSNQVTVYTHAQVTAVSLVLEQSSTNTAPVPGCLSQTQTAQLDSQAYYSVQGVQTLLCAPNSSTVPNCSTAIGNLTYTSQNTSIATISETGQITAVLPGTTYITASVAGSGSSAGYFSTCPPANINVNLNGATTGTVTQGVTQNLVTTITDTQGNTIQGLTLAYQSTNPLDISVGSGGAVTANFAGQATIYAVCQPQTCNPSPIDKVGVNLTGTSITSNPVTITTPGLASDYVWMASPMSPCVRCAAPLPGLAPSVGSQYFTPVELISGTVGSPVKMPYIPNSMVMDRTGTSLYFGSTHELMVYTTSTNTLTKEDPNVPGVVLAASPTNQQILINDPVRQVFYLYTASAGTFSTYSGVGTWAQWTPDAQTLYVTGYVVNASGIQVPTFFVYNTNTGWTTYPLASGEPVNQTTPASNLTVAVPGAGAFLSGNPTVAYAWCPAVSSTNTILQAYPEIPSVSLPWTDILTATTDGEHILGVGLDGGTSPTLTDVNVNLLASLTSGACPSSNGSSTKITKSPVTQVLQAPAGALGFQANAINQVVPSPASNLAFVTYTPTSTPGAATLPYYQPTTNGSLGTVGQVTFNEPSATTSPATAPLAGVFSLDDTIFFVSTSGDNLVHYISVKSLTDTQQINPGLVDVNGNPLPATTIAAKPRPTT